MTFAVNFESKFLTISKTTLNFKIKKNHGHFVSPREARTSIIKFFKEQDYTEFAGTPEFYPPEWFRERRYNGKRASVWSLGVLLFTMTQGEVRI